MKHTKEPWSDSDGYLAGPDSPVNFIMIASPWVEDYLISGSAKPEEIMEARANAARIVECVNALAGIEDPERFVRLAKEVVECSAMLEKAECIGEHGEIQSEMNRGLGLMAELMEPPCPVKTNPS